MLRMRPLGIFGFGEGTVHSGTPANPPPNPNAPVNVAGVVCPYGWSPNGNTFLACPSGSQPEYTQNNQCRRCSINSNSTNYNSTNNGNIVPGGYGYSSTPTTQGNCPVGWFVTDPYNANPCPPGQYTQTFSPDGNTQCGRCQLVGSAGSPFTCPSGWTDQQIPCNPGEQPLELIHRNSDGSIVSCFQCRQTQQSIMYQQSIAAGQQATAPATPTPVQVTSPTDTGFLSTWSTTEKVAAVGAIAVVGYLLFNKKGR